MFDLNEISSNIILVGFVIIGILCLYLLYSNFNKSRQIAELQIRVEDMKNIFINQQKHNDETYEHIMNSINNKQLLETPDINNQHSPNSMHLTKETLEAFTNNTIPTKTVNINPNISNSELLINKSKITNQNLIQNMDIENIDDIDDIENINLNDETNKEINIDLHDLDSMSDVHSDDSNINGNNNNDNMDDDIEKISFEDGEIEEIEDIEDIDNTNIFDPRHSIIKDDDNESIATEQMISDADLNDIMNEEIDLQEVNNNISEEPDYDDTNDTNEINNTNENNDDLDNIDLDLDLDLELDLNEIDNVSPATAEKTKQISLDDLATLEETIINNINPDDTTKTITFDTNNNNTETETIELDKLLSGDVKKIELKKENSKDTNDNLNTDVNSMSLKQLKEHAKSLKIKTTGLSKQDLINAINNLNA
jgi:hypothetical protein